MPTISGLACTCLAGKERKGWQEEELGWQAGKAMAQQAIAAFGAAAAQRSAAQKLGSAMQHSAAQQAQHSTAHQAGLLDAAVAQQQQLRALVVGQDRVHLWCTEGRGSGDVL